MHVCIVKIEAMPIVRSKVSRYMIFDYVVESDNVVFRIESEERGQRILHELHWIRGEWLRFESLYCRCAAITWIAS